MTAEGRTKGVWESHADPRRVVDNHWFTI